MPDSSRFSPSRRSILLGGVAGLGSAAIATPAATAAPAHGRAVATAGTTLEQVAVKERAEGYSRLTAGEGYELVVREDLQAAKPGRDDTRTARASFVQVTDLHMIDAQSPVRFEWLHPVNGSAFRPQEALGSHGAASLVSRINAVGAGPFTGRPFDCVVTTGDNTDNMEQIELDWYLTALSGGEIIQNTGAADRWEGVQTAGDDLYYHPEDDLADDYKKAGFPLLPGFFDRAIAPHTSAGLDMPWFSVFGNHDNSIVGVLPRTIGTLDSWYLGDWKFTGFAAPSADRDLTRALRSNSTAIMREPTDADRTWRVTADDRRQPLTPVEHMARHLRSAVDGPGPHGHGYTEENLDSGAGYYSFRIADGVTGIAMDSTNRAGFTNGSLGDAQFRWLKKTLAAGCSRYYDDWGIQRRHRVEDELFILFSHHTSGTMTNLLLDPALPGDMRHAGFEVVSTIKRFPNVLAWVNGHTHRNAITPQKHSDPTRSFWEINTASHVDFPQQARAIDVCDNTDGTISLFTTLLEAEAPYSAAHDSGDPQALASLYRELSANDLHADLETAGAPQDRNTELLLRHPFA